MNGHKATPGPWKVCRNDGGELCIATNENEPWYIAEMYLGAGGFHDGDPAEANAAFIVKACNSHDALVKALEAMLVDPPSSLDEPDTDAEVIRKLRAIARQALAKAGTDLRVVERVGFLNAGERT